MTADKLDVEPPTLPRKRKRPQRYESGSAEPEFHDSPKAYFKVSYFEGLDLVTTSIQERFDQPGFRPSLKNCWFEVRGRKEFRVGR